MTNAMLVRATGTTKGMDAMTEPTPPDPTAPPGTLRLSDVVRIWTEEARKQDPSREPLRAATVSTYLKQSRRPGGRYLANPMPMPDGYTGRDMNGPWWNASQEQALRDWWNDRPTKGHGTGGRRAGSTRR